MQRGKFITVEGIEGVGKSSNVEVLRKAIEQRGIPVLTSREPGGTPMAEQIRELLVQHRDEPMPGVAELLLMFASRALHVQNRIEPALAAGTWVVCDRFTDASRAYQGGGRGFLQADINRLAELVHPGLQPDMTLLLDAPVATGMGRAGRRGSPDRFELERHDFFSRVRQQYLALAAAEPERFVVINADASIEHVGREVAAAIYRLLDDVLGK